MHHLQTVEQLKRSILVFSVLSILIVGAIVAIAAIVPLFNHLKEDSARYLLNAAKSRKMAIEQFLSKLEQTTWQITSRTRIREELEQYNRGEVSLQQLVDFVKPKLEDALLLSKQAVGCLRFDENGKPVVQAGRPLPKFFRKLSRKVEGRLWMHGPISIDDALYMVVGAPIFNRRKVQVGTDLVMFQLDELRAIVQDDTGLGDTGEAILGMEVDKSRVRLFFPPSKTAEKYADYVDITSPLGLAMAQAAHLGQDESRLLAPASDGSHVYACVSIPHIDNWAMVVRMNASELYAPIKHQLIIISLLIFTLLLLGTLTAILLLRPLAGKIVIHTEQLESITQQLVRDADERQRLQTDLYNNYNEMKESARQLEQSRNMLQLILESIPVRVFWKDRDSRYLGGNTLFARDAGFSCAEQLPGRDDCDMVWRDLAERYRADDRQVITSARPKMNVIEPQTTPTGARIWLNTSKVPLQMPDGEIIGLLGVYEDITARKEAEERIKESEAKYMDLYENAPDMYISVNAETALIEECNHTFLHTMGYSREEIIGRLVFDIYHQDCLEKVKSTFRVFAKTGEAHDVELQLQRKDGSKLDVGLNVSSVRGQDGRILFSRSILHDITERKRYNAINAARLHLMQFASTHVLDDFFEETLSAAENLTQSKISFFAFVEDAHISFTQPIWSARTRAECGNTKGKEPHRNSAGAGVWTDCIIQGRPVIHNDYASLKHRRGMPERHVELIRELVVPVLRDDKIKAVVAVGNKSGKYNETDVEAVSLLANLSWEIGERKRAEEKMLRSDQRLRLHSEKSPLGFLEWDDNFRAIEWNAACERIFGYTREEAIGRHAKDLLLPIEVQELVDQIFQRLMRQSGGQHSVNENVTKDGRIIICEWFNTTLINEDGQAIGVASVCRDITEQKRMEAELARYREHLEEQVKARTAELEIAINKAQQYLDIAGVILVAIDKDRKVTLINQKGCEVLHGTSAQIIGKDWFETFVAQNARQDMIKGFEQLMAGECELMEYFENAVLTQDGRERLVAWHSALLRDGEGHIAGTLSSGEDITERRRAEKQIIDLNQDLRNRADALEATNKELDAFAYSVSHDLRAPLRHIDGFIELLQKKAGTALDDQSRHYMENISNSAVKMGTLIDDLLSFSRMGRQAMSLQPVELGRMVHEVIRELEPDAAGRRIEWRIGGLPIVNADASMLRIVLSNLIANAMKFTRSRQQARIEIGSQSGRPGETVIVVRDNGVGFDMTYADRLFGVFQRLHRADEFEGTGIGLANVRRIIARHGGRTWGEGVPNRGAVFYFSLPQTP